MIEYEVIDRKQIPDRRKPGPAPETYGRWNLIVEQLRHMGHHQALRITPVATCGGTISALHAAATRANVTISAVEMGGDVYAWRRA